MTELERCLSNIDLVALITKDLGAAPPEKWPLDFWLCPFHPDKKTPSLGVNRQNGSWHCFGCTKGGNAISWLCAFHRLRFDEALAVLGLSEYFQKERKVNTIYPERSQLVEEKVTTSPPELWQKRGLAFLEYARNQLWQTPSALEYLHVKRLLKETTIQTFGLGYNPTEIWDSPDRWGISNEEVKKGLGCPKGTSFLALLRNLSGTSKSAKLKKEPKYMHVRGSSPALFGADSLFGAPLILLTEGEFDCMLTWQFFE